MRKRHQILEEVKARSGKIILLTDKKGKDLSKNLTKSIFQLPNLFGFSLVPILYALPLQLIAYYTALLQRDKLIDVDQPRNRTLAKSILHVMN